MELSHSGSKTQPSWGISEMSEWEGVKLTDWPPVVVGAGVGGGCPVSGGVSFKNRSFRNTAARQLPGAGNCNSSLSSQRGMYLVHQALPSRF